MTQMLCGFCKGPLVLNWCPACEAIVEEDAQDAPVQQQKGEKMPTFEGQETIWKEIPGLERYEASSSGEIRSKKTLVPLKQRPNGRGYPRVSVSSNEGKHRTVAVHILVAGAFLGPRGDLTTNHKDGIKSNNCRENLEYVTNIENQRHAWRLGLFNFKGARHNQAIFDDTDVVQIRLFGKKYGLSSYRLAKMFSVGASTIRSVVSGRCYAE